MANDLSYSVVIPAFNAVTTIGQAVQSVLDQTVRPLEIIVIDDGSTDGTAAAIAGMGGDITVISQENRGPGAATTAGFRRVVTPFVATLDADDLWLPQKIERQAALFRNDPGLAGVFSLARLFADGAVPDPNGEGAIRRLWTRTTLLFRIEAAHAVGDFVDLPGQLGEVIDWLARSRDLGQRHAIVEEILALRRIRPGSLSYGHDAERSRGYLAAVLAALERKRQVPKKGGDGTNLSVGRPPQRSSEARDQLRRSTTYGVRSCWLNGLPLNSVPLSSARKAEWRRLYRLNLQSIFRYGDQGPVGVLPVCAHA